MLKFDAAVRSFHETLRGVEVDALAPSSCASLIAELARLRKACEAVEVALAARAASSGAHRRAGFAAAPDWLAALSGTTAHAARMALDTIAEVESCPTTRDALFDGRVSIEQAREIVHTEEVAPGCEADLVELASHSGLRRVRNAARDLRAAAIPPDELYDRQHAARSFVSWRDELGMICVHGRLMPEDGIPLVKRIEAEVRRLRRERRSVEPFEALAADAFTALVKRSANTREPRVDLVLVCDIAAWLRGHAHEGEVAKIVGGGPLPVSVIQQLSTNAFFKVVLHDGVQVQTVAHYKRSIPAHVRTALELGCPPSFDGPRCSEPNCDRTHHLERDHADPVANGGVTNASNLEWKCTPDHDEKTRRDRAAGKLGGRSP
ncbi:MAG TPA: DUF222 domain-containing protein [Acidimicrobiia bacterium]|nr:DUF222 domain-containing protein [Acidimicrobiia bacterium]